MVNVGLDWDFWGKKLYGSFDMFKEWRSDILVDRTTNPAILGITFAKDSYGKVESKGLELTIGHTNKIGKVTYSIEGLLSWNTNKITEMDEPEPAVEWQRKTESASLTTLRCHRSTSGKTARQSVDGTSTASCSGHRIPT